MMLQRLRQSWLLSSKWGRRLLELLVFLVLFLAVRAYLLRGTVAGPAPAIEAVQLDGRPVSLQSLHGKPVLLHFWATWCPICNLELGSIEALSHDYTVVTVAMQSGDADKVRAFMKEKGVDFPVIVDADGYLARRYGVRGVPASFFIDRSGQIRTAEIGYTSEWGMRLRLWLLR